MRAVRTTLAVTCLLGLASGHALAVDVAGLLRYRPSLEGVEYDRPTDPAAVAACKAEELPGKSGYLLRDGQGKILCKLVDRDHNLKLDQWSYYQDGFEVCRELDNNGDMSLDEVRFMNGAGTRVARMSGKKIVAWTRISAEEASKVFVQAIVAGDPALLETVMASPAELEALGVPKGEVDLVAAAEKQRVTAYNALRAGVRKLGWDDNTAWLRLDGALPHLIPGDAGLKDDLVLFENAVIFAGSPATQANPGRVAFLQASEIVKIGDTWKFVDLPRVVDPGKNGVIAAVEGGIRSWVYRNDGNEAQAGENPQVAAAIQALAAYDKANEALLAGVSPKDRARYHVGRIAPINEVVKASEAAGDAKVALDHLKLSVDSLAAAYASGAYPAGSKYLDEMTGKGGKIGSYAAFKLIEADFALQEAAQPNFIMVQKGWLANLGTFVAKYPASDEAPQALLFIASTHDMNGEEDEAKKSYAILAKDYASTEWGKKAAGALRRLDLVGKPMVLRGTETRGKAVDVASTYAGKTVLVTFWATWADPAKRDLPELAKLAARYKAKGFEILAVNLDEKKADLDAFLATNPLPWPEVFEPGGMESRLATEFGIISLPTMFLVDAEGKVVNRSLRTAAELEIVLDKMFAPKAGVALGAKP